MNFNVCAQFLAHFCLKNPKTTSLTEVCVCARVRPASGYSFEEQFNNASSCLGLAAAVVFVLAEVEDGRRAARFPVSHSVCVSFKPLTCPIAMGLAQGCSYVGA